MLFPNSLSRSDAWAVRLCDLWRTLLAKHFKSKAQVRGRSVQTAKRKSNHCYPWTMTILPLWSPPGKARQSPGVMWSWPLKGCERTAQKLSLLMQYKAYGHTR
jgi:hypothetical protein